MKNKFLGFLAPMLALIFSCSKGSGGGSPKPEPPKPDPPKVEEVVYDETGVKYKTVKNLVMAGYQGWFAAQGDGSNRGWYHYQNGKCGGFKPGCSAVDFWPDMSEYTKKYASPFSFADGSNAPLYSPYDEESVDLHFKWMKDYGIDGVYMQRFVVEIKPSNAAGKRHFNKVLENALKAANKYDRAICVMYDLSGANSEDVAYIEQDWNELQQLFSLFDNKKNPMYLRHNKRPLVVLWGVGFNDGRQYSVADVDKLVDRIKGPTKKTSVMLGVPYYWRSLKTDTENSTVLHPLIKKCDVIMPWAVGRYGNDNYNNVAGTELPQDIQWCKNNNVDYMPLAFPGFSWGNLKLDAAQYNSIPRLKGDFLWKQIAGAKMSGAESLYLAMFDEIDEGTAIFKCAKEGQLPLHADKKFVGIEDGLASDYYLWLAGEGNKWFKGLGSYGPTKPVRN